MPTSRDINPLVVKSLMATRDLCGAHGIVMDLAIVSGNAVIQWARDEVMRLFLATKANRLFCIDSDIVWSPEDFMRFMALSQKFDVVCASYPAKKDQPTFYIRYDKDKPPQSDKLGLIEIFGAGLGFTVVNRSVLETISSFSDIVMDEISGKTYSSIFNVGKHNGNRRGEDMSFFESLRDFGYGVFLDPSITLGHIGNKVYSGKALDAMVVQGGD